MKKLFNIIIIVVLILLAISAITLPIWLPILIVHILTLSINGKFIT